MQNTSANAHGCPQKDRTASEGYVGVQTYMEIIEGELVEMHFEGQGLMEQIIDFANLRTAYKQVVRNKGKGGVDGMDVNDLFTWCQSHIEDLRQSLMDGTFVPNPVRRVEIPKDNGKKRLLGIPTVIDRMVQQAISQVLSRIYEPQFSRTSYGFRPRRGAHDALREARRNVTEGYRYAVGIDLERFFDTVNQSKLTEVLSRTIRDGRVVSLIHKYLVLPDSMSAGDFESDCIAERGLFGTDTTSKTAGQKVHSCDLESAEHLNENKQYVDPNWKKYAELIVGICRE